MTTSSPGPVPSGSVPSGSVPSGSVPSGSASAVPGEPARRAARPAPARFLRRLRRAGDGLVRGLRGATRPAAVAGAARWAHGLGGGPVPRAAAQRRSRVQGTRAARSRRSAVLPAHPAAGPDRGLGRRVARPGSVAAVGGPGPRRRPRAAVVPAPGAGRPRALRRARAPAGQAGARLRRAGRRGAGGEPGGAPAGERPGLAAGGRDGDPGRRRRHHRRDAAGLPGRPRSGRSRRYGSCRPCRRNHTGNAEEYPNGCRKNYALLHLPRSGSLELQICCRTVISDTVGGAPSGTRTGLSGGTTDGCSEVELPLPSVLRCPPRERARSPSGDCRDRPERRGPGSLPGTRRREGRAVGALRPQDRRDGGGTVPRAQPPPAQELPARRDHRPRLRTRRARRGVRAGLLLRPGRGDRQARVTPAPLARPAPHHRTPLDGAGGPRRRRPDDAARRAPGRRGRPTGSPRRAGGRPTTRARPRQRLGRHGRPGRRHRERPRGPTSRTTRISTTSTGRAGSSAARCTPRTR